MSVLSEPDHSQILPKILVLYRNLNIENNFEYKSREFG